MQQQAHTLGIQEGGRDCDAASISITASATSRCSIRVRQGTLPSSISTTGLASGGSKAAGGGAPAVAASLAVCHSSNVESSGGSSSRNGTTAGVSRGAWGPETRSCPGVLLPGAAVAGNCSASGQQQMLQDTCQTRVTPPPSSAKAGVQPSTTSFVGSATSTTAAAAAVGLGGSEEKRFPPIEHAAGQAEGMGLTGVLLLCREIGLLDNMTEHSDIVHLYQVAQHQKHGRIGPYEAVTLLPSREAAATPNSSSAAFSTGGDEKMNGNPVDTAAELVIVRTLRPGVPLTCAHLDNKAAHPSCGHQQPSPGSAPPCEVSRGSAAGAASSRLDAEELLHVLLQVSALHLPTDCSLLPLVSSQ